jgi:Flp pilus assembly protein TadD
MVSLRRYACITLLVYSSSFLLQASRASAQQPAVDAPSGLPFSLNPPIIFSGPGNYQSTIADFVKRKRWSELLVLTQDLAAKNSTDPNVFYWEGIASFQLHKPVGAVRAMRVAEKLGLDQPLLHEGLGLAYYDLNQFVLFEEQMKLASREDPNDFAPAYYLGLYRLSIQSDVGGALAYFREAVRLNPSDWKSLYQQGYCLELSGDSAGARESYLKSIHLVEENEQGFGWPYQGMARIDATTDLNEALFYAKKAVEIEPDEPSHHFILAKTYELSGDMAAAIKEGRIAASQDPNHAAVRYLLFRLYRKLGDTASANAELKLFQTLNAVYGPE